jgi:hypothetical protein
MKAYLILLVDESHHTEFAYTSAKNVVEACKKINLDEDSPRIYTIFEEVDRGSGKREWRELTRTTTIKWNSNM